MATEFGTLTEYFEDFAEKVFPKAGPEQYRDIKLIFFAGTKALMDKILNSPDSEEEEERYLQELMDEIDKTCASFFVESLKH